MDLHSGGVIIKSDEPFYTCLAELRVLAKKKQALPVSVDISEIISRLQEAFLNATSDRDNKVTKCQNRLNKERLHFKTKLEELDDDLMKRLTVLESHAHEQNEEYHRRLAAQVEATKLSSSLMSTLTELKQCTEMMPEILPSVKK